MVLGSLAFAAGVLGLWWAEPSIQAAIIAGATFPVAILVTGRVADLLLRVVLTVIATGSLAFGTARIAMLVWPLAVVGPVAVRVPVPPTPGGSGSADRAATDAGSADRSATDAAADRAAIDSGIVHLRDSAVAVAPGVLAVTWQLTDPAGAPIECAAAGAIRVRVTAKPRGEGRVESIEVGCLGNLSSTPLSPGVYDISFQLLALGDRVIATAPEQSAAILPGQHSRLHPISFVINPPSSFVFSIAAKSTTANCKATTAGGAAITAISIALFNAAGACVPARLRLAGRAPRGTYNVNCSAPAIAPCVERDTRLETSDLPPGKYTIRVRGKIGTLDCWHGDDTLQVPSRATPVVNLVFQSGLPGCAFEPGHAPPR